MGLFKPGWMNNDVDKALHAVEKLTNQSGLAKAAKNAPDRRVRMKAVEKLTDQAVLINIVNNDKDSEVRITALKKITDEKALAGIAINNEFRNVCVEAVSKLTTESILAEVAKKDRLGFVSKRAVEKVLTQASLVDVAKNANYIGTKKEAVQKLTDQAKLLDLANNESDSAIRLTAAEKLNNETSAQRVFSEIAKNQNNPSSIRREAAEKLTDQGLLLELANTEIDNSVRLAAANKLENETIAQKVYSEIAKNERDYHIRQKAVEKLTDQALLLDLVKNDHNTRKESIRNLSPESLKNIMLFCCDADTSDLLKKIGNDVMKKEIAEALSNELPKGFSELFTDIDEYKKISEVFKYREEKKEKTSVTCGTTERWTEKYGFNFPPFEG